MNLKKVSYKLLFLLGFLSCMASTSYAQLANVGKVLQASKEDANLLVREYLNPAENGFGAGLNTGWTNTAKPHKKLGFDLTVSSALAIVPASDKTFDVNTIGLTELELENSNADPTAQTVNGSGETGPTLAAYTTINGNRKKLFDFDMPGGTNFGYVPSPQIKGSIGLIMDTDVMFRYVPKVSVKDYGTFQQYGFGLKHGINHWLPGGKLLPVDISVMVGYTDQKVTSGFRLTAEDIIGNNQSEIENPYKNRPETWDGQKIRLETNAFTINALVGKTLPVISVYGGIGYETSKISIETPGTYPTVDKKEQGQGSDSSKPLIVETFDKPIDVKVNGTNHFHALAGFRFRFAIFNISGSYTLANYSSFNVGFGISFR